MPRGSSALAAAAWALAAAVFSPAEAADGPRYRDYLYVRVLPRSEADVLRIWELAESVIAPHDPALTPHEVAVTRATLARLAADGIPTQVQPIDVQAWIAHSYRQALRPGAALYAGKLGIYGPWFSKVQNLEAVGSYLQELVQAGNGRAQLASLGKSVEGREIMAMRISSPSPGAAERASVVVLGTQHAREWASPMVAMGLIDGLIRQYDKDPKVKRVVDNLDIHIIPVGNPDGYHATFNGRRMQRRNMNPACNVDLNRNYDAGWGMGVPRGSCGGDTFPGSGAFSEPESQAVRKLIESLPRPRLFIDYHSTAAQVMIPYAYTTMRPPNYEKNKTWCELYSSTLRDLNGTSHPARPGFNLGRGQGGGAFDWFRMKHSESIVVELGGGPGFDIAASAIVPTAEENFVAWLAVAEKVVEENPASGQPPAPPGPTADAGRPSPPPEPTPDAGGPRPEAPHPDAPPTSADAAATSTDAASDRAGGADATVAGDVGNPVSPPSDAAQATPPDRVVGCACHLGSGRHEGGHVSLPALALVLALGRRRGRPPARGSQGPAGEGRDSRRRSSSSPDCVSTSASPRTGCQARTTCAPGRSSRTSKPPR